MTTRVGGRASPIEARRPVPGDGLLHPLALGAVALLLVNDHVLKAIAPGLLTGKLSDIAGLVFFPLLLVAATEAVASGFGRWRGPSRVAVVAAVATTALAFAAVKLLPAAESGLEATVGLLQWPVRGLLNFATGVPVGPPAPVDIIRDSTDLVALAALAIAWRLGIGRASGTQNVFEKRVA